MLITFAVDTELRRIIRKYILQRKVMDFADSQSTFEHEGEHGFIAWILNVRKKNLDFLLTGIARKRLWLAEKVSLRNNWAWHGNIVDDGEKVIERAE